ncbi:hypothetical protein [uncultured Hymenobacter sp.]|uniref:hypothetical protein n=1 Tax=uncultured Hymenobacter sp. TaxID=170016 RepID=UPI0035CBD623
MPPTLITQLRRGLAGRRLFLALLGLNLLVSALVFFAFRNQVSGDHYTYLGYAEGLARGRYSYWYFLPEYVPDTFRNPGYPLFVLAVRTLTQSVLALKLLQLVLYFGAVALTLAALRRLSAPGSWRSCNLFLLLLLPNIQGAYFAALVFPEVLVGFLLLLYFHVALVRAPGSWVRAALLAGLAGALVQVRPMFILFPLAQVALDWGWQRRAFRRGPAGGFLLLFGLTLLPYAAWNYRHHGTFKVTSLEGGGGVLQIGFWALRMPGYHEQRYWGNTMGDELVQFAAPTQVPGYIRAFNQEWDEIERQCAPLLTRRDSTYLPRMRQRPELFPTYSSAYTRRREQLLVRYTLAHIRAEPGYFLQTRLYTLVRLWVTGVQRRDWAAAPTPLARLKVLYPFLSSAATFLLALVCIPWALARRGLGRVPAFALALALVVYFGVMHLPFAIQARYTVPARLLLLFCVAQAISALLEVPAARAAGKRVKA